MKTCDVEDESFKEEMELIIKIFQHGLPILELYEAVQ